MKVRWAYERIGPPYWGSKPTILIGGGPSWLGHDLNQLCGKVHACAVKGTIFDYPWCDAGFGLDTVELKRWWLKFRKIMFPIWWAVPERWSDHRMPTKPDALHFVRRSPEESLSDDNGQINGGGTSGFGALNLAYLKRARFVVLFGYDYGPSNGKWHANDQHYNPHHVYNPHDWGRWAAAFDKIVDQLRLSGTEVVNASPDSNIAAFRKVTVEEGIRLCQQ